MRVTRSPSKSTPPFEVAIWELEATLATFISEARAELKAAETSSDAVAIARAEKKELLMLHAGSVSQYDLSELRSYLKVHQEQIL